MVVELFTLVMALFLIAIIFIPTLITGSSPVPTSSSVRKTVLGVLPKRLLGPPEGCVYDLGSGWGGMAVALAKKYPDRQIVGYEISPLPWLISKLRHMVFRHKNVQFKYGNFGKRDLSDAVLVLCYLIPKPMGDLQKKLEKELKTGALVVSNTFAFHAWRPLEYKTADDMYGSHVYLYEAGNTEK